MFVVANNKAERREVTAGRRTAGRDSGDQGPDRRRGRGDRSAGLADLRRDRAGAGQERRGGAFRAGGAARGGEPLTGSHHVSEQPLHQTAGVRDDDDGGARRPRHQLVSAAQRRPVPRSRIPDRHRHHALRGRVAGDRRTRRDAQDRGIDQHRRRRASHRVVVSGRHLQHHRPVQTGSADAGGVAGYPQQGGVDPQRAAARDRRAAGAAHQSRGNADRVGRRERGRHVRAGRDGSRGQDDQAASRNGRGRRRRQPGRRSRIARSAWWSTARGWKRIASR